MAPDIFPAGIGEGQWVDQALTGARETFRPGESVRERWGRISALQ
jgi:hypothetical protein